jgi:hypothetical protein
MYGKERDAQPHGLPGGEGVQTILFGGSKGEGMRGREGVVAGSRSLIRGKAHNKAAAGVARTISSCLPPVPSPASNHHRRCASTARPAHTLTHQPQHLLISTRAQPAHPHIPRHPICCVPLLTPQPA